MSLAADTRIGPYQVVSLLGVGGMGQVYRAHDSRLERDVALKVLPAGALSDETARTRLLREARLASKLNHAHICTIYEVGEADGQVFIAMELVEGRSLSARLAGGPLPVDEVLRYGQQMADALAHAHSRGVVHRDFKSLNVIVTPEGQAKVLDFGLAKRVAGEELAEAMTVTRQSLTAPGVVVGTLAYMAPEQLKGHPADERSDIWALGIVLHEMATGTRPFQGQTGFELTAAILNQPVPEVPASVPAPLANVVERCLTKEPGERYQQSSEVRAALEAVASGEAVARAPAPVPASGRQAAVVPRRRWMARAAAGVLGLAVIAAGVLFGLDVGGMRTRFMGTAGTLRLAVLPLANLSGDAGQEYLSDGLTQELIAQLGRLHPETLSVIARTSVMRYKKTDKPVDQIGRELGVDYLLEGSTQRQGDRIRIATELVKVADQTQLWADTYERELSAMLTVQGQVARSVAKALAVKLLPAEEARLAIVRTINPEAYDAYLKGTALWRSLKAADVDEAQRHFEQALEKDPSYVPAVSGLAGVWLLRGQMGLVWPSEAGPKAKALALQALALDDSSAEAHEALAQVLAWSEWDWRGADPEYRRTLELDPGAANAHAYYAHYLAIMGRAGEAVSHSERAITLDPFSPLYHAMHGMVLMYLRRYDDALAAANRAISMRADTSIAFSLIQRVYLAKGMRKEQLAEQRLRIARDPERVAAFDPGLAEGGYEGAQRAIADVLAARYGKGRTPNAAGTATHIAMRYLDAGDKERAIVWLQKAYDDHDQNLPYVSMPNWDPLRTDLRFQALLRRIGLPQA